MCVHMAKIHIYTSCMPKTFVFPVGARELRWQGIDVTCECMCGSASSSDGDMKKVQCEDYLSGAFLCIYVLYV
jgi:hypothetical protein